MIIIHKKPYNFLLIIFCILLIFLPNLNSIDVKIIIRGSNDAPYKPINPIPSNGQTNVNLNPTLSVYVKDPDNDPMDVFFYNNLDDNLIGIDENVQSGSIASTKWYGLDNFSYYEWYAISNDSGLENISDVWVFRTQDQPVEPPPENEPPFAYFYMSDNNAFIGESILFDASISHDPDGIIVEYNWDFDDGTYDSGNKTTHSYENVGTYQVKLTVIDDGGLSSYTIKSINITKANNPPTKPIINGPLFVDRNITYQFTALSYDNDNDSIKYIFNWGDEETTTTDFISNGAIAKANHSWSEYGEYTVTVKAYDGFAESSLNEHKIYSSELLPIDENITEFLVDEDGDGTYESYYNETTGYKTKIIKYNDTTYIFDIDGDDKWDLVYNMDNDIKEGFYDYITPKITPGFEFLYLIAIIVIILIIFRKREK